MKRITPRQSTRIAFALSLGLFASPLYAEPAYRQQATVLLPDKTAVVVYSLTEPEQRWFEGIRWFVRVGGRTHRLDGFGFESNDGPLYQSADGTRVAALRSFRGLARSGLEIDLSTGSAKELDGDADMEAMARDGWKRVLWHTKLEHASHEALFDKLRSDDAPVSSEAHEEFECRAWSEDYWPLVREFVFDKTIDSYARERVARHIHGGRKFAQLRALASDLNDKDADRRLFAAWVIGNLLGGDDETLRFDVADDATTKPAGAAQQRIKHAEAYARKALAVAATQPWHADDFK